IGYVGNCHSELFGQRLLQGKVPRLHVWVVIVLGNNHVRLAQGSRANDAGTGDDYRNRSREARLEGRGRSTVQKSWLIGVELLIAVVGAYWIVVGICIVFKRRVADAEPAA